MFSFVNLINKQYYNYMKFTFRLFEFMGSQVYLKIWFFLFLALLPFYDFLAVFVGILVHEMAHIYVAKKLNYRTGDITIDLFYGHAGISDVKNHNDNIAISAAGPLSNFIIMLICYALKLFIPEGSVFYDIASSFQNINFFLFFFNILPILPMDGGRISKSVLSKFFGNLKGAFYNGILSLTLSVTLFVVAMVYSQVILAIFSLLFAFLSYKEIENNKI